MESWPASGIKSPASQRAGKKVAWPSGLRRWFKAPVSSGAWVRIPPLPPSRKLNMLRWWQLMLKDLATSYPDIQLADSAGFPRLIDNEKINHQSMEAKSASLLMSQERKPSRSRQLLFLIQGQSSKTNLALTST